MTWASPEVADQQWREFLQRWPLESLDGMTLPQYTCSGDNDSFTYWLEVITEDLGSIWGGSAFKFGIYSRKDKTPKSGDQHTQYSSEYAWASKYGDSPESAFARVKRIIVDIAQAARRGDLAAIDAADLGTVTKWKLAFLYQDRASPSVLPVYLEDSLRLASGMAKPAAPGQMHAALMLKRGDQALMDYGRQVWEQASQLAAQQWSGQRLKELLDASEEVTAVKPATVKMAGFQTLDGRQLALEPGRKPALFLEPGDWLDAAEPFVSAVENYPAERTRHSGLEANAPRLWLGRPVVQVTLPSEDAFQSLLSLYLGSEPAVEAAKPKTGLQPMNSSPLNQILFGPPGTGKTYETIDAALAILAPDALGLERAERKARFDEFVAKGQVRVTTFHQSFSYEDFVEGIRAVPAATIGEDAAVGIQYQIEKGVFAQLCEDAQRNKVYEAQIGVRENARVWKISIEEASSTGETRQYCFKHGEARIGWRDVGDIRSANLADPAFKLGSNDQSSLANFGRDIAPGDVLVCLGTRTQISAVGIVTGEYEYSAQVPSGVRSDYVHKLPVRWLATDMKFDITPLNHGVGLTLKAVYPLWRIKWPALQDALHKADVVLAGEANASAPSIEPYVLVIDEINRGNISRIFGELITLIEESKRAGAPEALSVLLPYSKERFSVPGNLYLIGTMNTSDRSLAGLDIALRRRFVFREMPPRPELLNKVVVEAINVGQLLRVMNERIEVLLDRDHCLGHAYFMPLKDDPSLSRLELIFRNQVLPLLQEYFFEDWLRIQWVLNDHRKPAADRFVEQFKPDLNDLFGSKVTGVQGGIWRVMPDAFKRVSAYAGIISAKSELHIVEADNDAIAESEG